MWTWIRVVPGEGYGWEPHHVGRVFRSVVAGGGRCMVVMIRKHMSVMSEPY